jgi:hypothetical protein
LLINHAVLTNPDDRQTTVSITLWVGDVGAADSVELKPQLSMPKLVSDAAVKDSGREWERLLGHLEKIEGRTAIEGSIVFKLNATTLARMDDVYRKGGELLFQVRDVISERAEVRSLLNTFNKLASKRGVASALQETGGA